MTDLIILGDFLNLATLGVDFHSQYINRSCQQILSASFPNALDRRSMHSRDLAKQCSTRESSRQRKMVDRKRRRREEDDVEDIGVHVSGKASCMPIVGRISPGT